MLDAFLEEYLPGGGGGELGAPGLVSTMPASALRRLSSAGFVLFDATTTANGLHPHSRLLYGIGGTIVTSEYVACKRNRKRSESDVISE